MKYLEIIKEYILDILSVIIFILSLVFLFYNVYYNPLLKYNKTIKILSSQYQKNEINLHKKINVTEDKKEEQIVALNTIPQLLMRINNTCKAPKVVIRTLIPHTENPFAFELKFISNYFDFLHVLSEFEKLNININKIDIKPYEIKNNNSKHIITLDIEAINGGDKLSKDDVAFLDLELNKTKKRDPFQRFAKIGNSIKRLVDLTWMYHLSGLGKIDGNFVATINHRIYYKGSLFNGMKVTNITSKGVVLSKDTSNGVVNYILNFRYKKKEKNEKN